jgi:hypothetical protein
MDEKTKKMALYTLFLLMPAGSALIALHYLGGRMGWFSKIQVGAQTLWGRAKGLFKKKETTS